MALRHHASILLVAFTLNGCVLAAQEAHDSSRGTREFRIYNIFLPGVQGKPVSIKTTIEQIESLNGGKVAVKHWEEEMLRDNEGRVRVSAQAAKEDHPGKVPPVEVVWFYDPSSESVTMCQAAKRKCEPLSKEYYPHLETWFFNAEKTVQSVCFDAEGLCESSELHPSAWCGEKRFMRTILGEYSISGINIGRTRVMCYKPDGSGAGDDLWHNREFDLDFDVLNLPPRKGVTYYSIDQISHSVSDDPELFQVPPSGYSFQ